MLEVLPFNVLQTLAWLAANALKDAVPVMATQQTMMEMVMTTAVIAAHAVDTLAVLDLLMLAIHVVVDPVDMVDLVDLDQDQASVVLEAKVVVAPVDADPVEVHAAEAKVVMPKELALTKKFAEK